ncbi:MAG TPA: ABC transporter substrate-binding protein [Candidatus Limnocylindrales bacterium]
MTTSMRRAAGLLAVAALALSACSSSGGSAAPAGGAAIQPPDAVKTAGKLVWCVDVSYPPEEFYAADGSTAQGSDIDIANEIGKRFGVTSEIDNTAFDGIVAALLAKKCDLIISGMNDTPERQKEVDFVDYLKVGQGLLVPVGNPKGIHTLDDLSGKTVAVQLGTTNKDALDAANTALTAAGKPAIEIQTFEKDTDAFQQLSLGRVDAFSTDSPVVAYYNSKPENKGKYEIGGTPIDPAPIGIAVNKDNTALKTAVQAAIDAMYADGTMKSITDKWGMTDAVVFLK